MHGRFNPASAIAIARDLEPLRPGWVEEPVPPENLAALKKASEHIHIPVATGERIHTRYEADGMILRAIDRHAEYIKNETLSTMLALGREDGFDGKQIMLEGEQLWIGLKRS